MKILLTHPKEMLDLKFGAPALKALRELGSVKTNEGSYPLSLDALISAARGCDVILADRLAPGHARLFESVPEVVAFVRNAVDIRNIDLAAASRHGVLVTHAGPHFSDSVAELVVGQMIDLSRGLSHYVAAYRTGTLPVASMGRQLSGRTAGIIGLGRIGRRLAAVLQVLGMRVLATDPYAAIDDPNILGCGLDELLAQADFVVCVAAHTPRTDRLIDEGFLGKMKRDAYLLNVSRGALVDEAALARALDRKLIAGAALDVGDLTDDLPPPELGRRADVVATPHIGGLVAENIIGQAFDSVAQVRDILHGRVPDHALNADEADRWRNLVR